MDDYKRLAETSKKPDEEKERKLREIEEVRSGFIANGARGYWQKQLEIAKRRNSDFYYLAYYYANLGDKENALKSLETACEKKETVYQMNVEPVFDIIRDEPRFKDLLKRLNLPD